MKKNTLLYLTLIVLLITSQSCKKENLSSSNSNLENTTSTSPVPDGYFQTLNSSSNFGDRIKIINEPINLDSDSLGSNQAITRSDNDDSWLHVGEVTPLELNGLTLSATHVAFLDDKAYITYHRRGIEHLGALEIIDLSNPHNPEVIYLSSFNSADINSVEVGKLPGSNDVKIWLSLSDSKKGAVLGEITMTAGITFAGLKIVNLSNFVDSGISSSTNSVTFSGDYLYVSSGKTHGGAFCLNAETLEVLGVVEFPNGKYIDVNGTPTSATKVVSLQTGENSSLRVEDIGSFHFSTEYQIGEILHQNVDLDSRGKSSIHFTSNDPEEVYVAKGKHGLSRYNIYTGVETWSSSASMLTTGNTNGVSSDDKFIYAANGADGLAIFTNPGQGGTPELIFNWDMNESEASANFIEVDGTTEWVLIAKGQGGTKILRKPQQQNIALGKTATQSSRWSNSKFPASEAVDGITNNANGHNFNHTKNEQNAWWELDLGEVADLSAIKVFNRTNCCTGRLTDFHVFVSDVPFTSKDINETMNQSGVSDYHFPDSPQPITEINLNRQGRYVRVQLSGKNYLHVAEVQVFN